MLLPRLSVEILTSERTVYSRVTNNGQNLRVIIDRLSLAMDPSKDGWEEDDELKSVSYKIF